MVENVRSKIPFKQEHHTKKAKVFPLPIWPQIKRICIYIVVSLPLVACLLDGTAHTDCNPRAYMQLVVSQGYHFWILWHFEKVALSGTEITTFPWKQTAQMRQKSWLYSLSFFFTRLAISRRGSHSHSGFFLLKRRYLCSSSLLWWSGGGSLST